MTDEENNVKIHPEYGKYVSGGPIPKEWLEKERHEDIIMPYDGYEIHVRENDIMRVVPRKNDIDYYMVLSCSFKILSKCIYEKEVLYTFVLNGQEHHTKTIMEIVRRAEPYLRGGLKGKDCLKEVIRYYDGIVPQTKPREYLGFDDGWVLPQTEADLGVSIVSITDYQQMAYERAKKMIKDYDENEKKKIRKLMKTFIGATETNTLSGAMLIGWSIASAFRLTFLDYDGFFPILYNYGEPNSGRSSLEDFWIISFYGIYEDHLPASTSFARLEDHLSKSTFPISWQDLKEVNLKYDTQIISMLQDYSTCIGLYERKKSGKEVDFIRHMAAPLNLDSNEILSMFSDPAINERQVFVCYTQKIKPNSKWTKLRKELRKYKLFSLIYEYTKDWTSDEVEKLYLKYRDEFTAKYDANTGRLLKSAAIIRFGLDLFSEIFGITFKVHDRKLSNDDIINVIKSGSTQMTEHVVDQFREFCKVAINYNETKKVITEHPNGEIKTYDQRGSNPHYLNHALRLSQDGKYYAYISLNHHDYIKRYGTRIGMKALADKLKKGLNASEAKHIEYGRFRPFDDGKQMSTIKIYPGFLQESSEIDIERMSFDSVDDEDE